MNERRMHSAIGTVAGMTLLVAMTGCATKGFVRQEVAGVRTYTDTQVTDVRARADEAMTKATLAERLASGTLDYTEVSTQQVQFAYDDWTLDPASQSTLDQVTTNLSSHPRFVVEIRGYADGMGTDRYNYRLGRERAESVMRYLTTRHNIPSGRVAIISFGEENPIADNETEDGRAQNRRVQVRLLEEKVQNTPISMVPVND